jgi:hypothetical protein
LENHAEEIAALLFQTVFTYKDRQSLLAMENLIFSFCKQSALFIKKFLKQFAILFSRLSKTSLDSVSPRLKITLFRW